MKIKRGESLFFLLVAEIESWPRNFDTPGSVYSFITKKKKFDFFLKNPKKGIDKCSYVCYNVNVIKRENPQKKGSNYYVSERPLRNHGHRPH